MTNIPTGVSTADNYADDYSQLEFLVSQILGHAATCTLVQVVAVNGQPGLVQPVGLVDVQPMVQQMTGAGLAVAHATIHNVPYFRLQGGANAVIIDPVVNDIGIAVFASHDVSRVKNTRAPGLPGSWRRFDWADALYLGGLLNGAPQNYIQFDSAGNIHLAPANTLYVRGNIMATGDVQAGTVSLQNHVHTAVQPGTGLSGKPM